MAIEMRQIMKLSQQLVMTPQLQQAIKLLQLSRMELVDVIQKEMLENPVLEEIPEAQPEEIPPRETYQEKSQEVADSASDQTANEPKDFDWENYIDQYNAPGSISTIIKDELPTYEMFVAKKTSLADHLLWQLGMTELEEKEQNIAEILIGEVNDDGYLESSIEEISRGSGAPLSLVESVLKKIQEFDPPGVCCRDLKECLLLQVKQLGSENEVLIEIIEKHLGDLQRKNYQGIARSLKLPIEDVHHAVRVLSALEPKPGRPFVTEEPQYITPDIFVYKVGNEYIVVLNEDGLPRLRISNYYRSALSGTSKGDNSPTRSYIENKIKSAIWLIRSIHQRQRTIYRVTSSIVKFQRDFFDNGIAHLKPLILRDVAEDIGMHESTISRVTTNKYVHTPQGIYELKFFFNSSINQVEGDGVASEAVKSKIKQLIVNEDSRKPLSDQQIVELLKKENINIARRTVAKYREMLNILSSSKRKKVF